MPAYPEPIPRNAAPPALLPWRRITTPIAGNNGAMDFYSAYQQGFVRVAACTQPVSLADPAANVTVPDAPPETPVTV